MNSMTLCSLLGEKTSHALSFTDITILYYITKVYIFRINIKYLNIPYGGLLYLAVSTLFEFAPNQDFFPKPHWMEVILRKNMASCEIERKTHPP